MNPDTCMPGVSPFLDPAQNTWNLGLSIQLALGLLSGFVLQRADCATHVGTPGTRDGQGAACVGGVDRAWMGGLGSYMPMRPLKVRDGAEGEKRVCRGLGKGACFG